MTVYLAINRVQLALVRYFDPDELQYVSWAYQEFIGKKPFVDYVQFTTRGFMWVYGLLFHFWSGVNLLLAGRMLSVSLFFLLILTTTYLFWLMRKSWLAVIIPLLFLFLPMPSDKLFEIRPDVLATLLAVLGTVGQVLWMTREGRIENGKGKMILSGFFYGLSLAVSQKMVGYVGIAIIIALLWSIPNFKKIIPFFAGLGIVILGFSLWLLHLGDWSIIFYSLTKLPQEIQALSRIYFIGPWQAFQPNGVYYGTWGEHIGFTLNLWIWFIGLGFACFRLVTPFFPNGKKGVWSELLVSALCITNIVLFVSYVPQKFTQYLIPVVPFIVFFAVDALTFIWQFLRTKWAGELVFLASWLVFLMMMMRGSELVYQPKFNWTNRVTLDRLNKMERIIPKNAYVFDLEGLAWAWPQPYPACCMPIGQLQPFVTKPIFPSIEEMLKKTNTQYIYQGDTKRVATLSPADRAYIDEQFAAAEDGTLLIRKDATDQK